MDTSTVEQAGSKPADSALNSEAAAALIAEAKATLVEAPPETHPAQVATVRINVLKPFVLTYWPNPQAKRDNRGAVERKFKPGFIDVSADDPMFDNPWITRDYADGCIERPEAAKIRLEKAAEVAKQFLVDKEQANAAAEAALMRAVRGRGEQAKVDEEAFRKEINTPVNELRSQGLGVAGPDVVKPVSEMGHGYVPPVGPGGPPRPGL